MIFIYEWTQIIFLYKKCILSATFKMTLTDLSFYML